jgi:hypothetical protein
MRCRYGALKPPTSGQPLAPEQLRNRLRNDQLLAEQEASGVVSRQKVVLDDDDEDPEQAAANARAKLTAKQQGAQQAKAAKWAAVRTMPSQAMPCLQCRPCTDWSPSCAVPVFVLPLVAVQQKKCRKKVPLRVLLLLLLLLLLLVL